MSENYELCQCKDHNKNSKILTFLILQCWQRESFKRPYNHLYLNRKIFESRLNHEFNIDDYVTMIMFLENHPEIIKFRMQGFKIESNYPIELHKKFGKTLQQRSEVELLNSEFPSVILKILLDDPSTLTIKVLRLNGTPITESAAHLIRCFLLNNKTIEFLDVGSCNLTEKIFCIIADGVYNSTSIKAFNMNRLILEYKTYLMDTEKLSLLISQLIWKKHLVELHIRNLSLTSMDIKPIAEYIGDVNSNLQYLDLGSNLISCDGIEIIFKAIVRSKHIIGLDISHNCIGHNGGEIIAFSLPNTKIKYLNIAHNGIDSIGMHLIISVVKKPIRLKILNIYGNEISSNTSYTLKRQIAATTLIADDLDVDVIFDPHKNNFYLSPQIKLPPLVGRYLNKYNLLK